MCTFILQALQLLYLATTTFVSTFFAFLFLCRLSLLPFMFYVFLPRYHHVHGYIIAHLLYTDSYRVYNSPIIAIARPPQRSLHFTIASEKTKIRFEHGCSLAKGRNNVNISSWLLIFMLGIHDIIFLITARLANKKLIV